MKGEGTLQALLAVAVTAAGSGVLTATPAENRSGSRRPVVNNKIINPKKMKVKEIIIHCSATPEGRDVSAAEITRWHKARGFRTIGYHYVIRLDGSVEAGRPETEIGAHCLGHNARSIGVCYVGGLDRNTLRPKDTRTPAQRKALRALVSELLARYPGATIHGHREFAAKACPCFDVEKEL